MVDIPRDFESERLAEEPFNAADEKQVNTARKKGARKDRERLVVVQALMQNAQTRAYVYDFLFACHIFDNPMVQGDTHATAFNLGEQNIGKKLLMDVMQFPDEYVLMMSESKTRK